LASQPTIRAASPSLSSDLVVPTAWPFSKKKAEWGVPMSAAPDLSKSRDQYHAEYSDRAIVSPAHGLEAPKEPNMFQRMGQSMSNSGFVRGIKSAFKGSSKNPKPAKTSSSSSASSMPEQDPDANLHIQLGQLQERSGNHQVAEAMFRKAVTVEPKNPTAHLELARYLDRQKRHAEAEQSYAKVIKFTPEDSAAWNDLGMCQIQQEKPAEAIRSIEQAIQLDPKRKLYRNNLARVLVEVGRADDALTQLSAVHSQAVAHYNLGYLLNERGQPQRAAAEFREALSHDPTLTAASDWLTAIEGGGQRAPSASRDDRTVVNRTNSAAELQMPDRVAARPDREEDDVRTPKKATRLPVDRADVDDEVRVEDLALPPLPDLLDEPTGAARKPRMAERPGAPASR